MKITVEFDAQTPAQALVVLNDVKRLIMYEYNPDKWKAPTVHLRATPTGSGNVPVKVVIS